jgi:alpha-tubulin suppressor-like RCC1 family protein
MGHGGFDDELTAQKIDLGEGTEIKQVAAGWGHSAVLTHDGDVLIFGRTHDFKSVLSLASMHARLPWLVYLQNWASGGSGVESLDPELVKLPEGEISVSVACSAAFTAIVTESGKVFCFGMNHYGQCGIGNDNVRVWEPTEVKGFGDEHVVQVSLGFSHALAVTESGRVFSWGKGERGQLGRPENKVKLVAEPITTTEETHLLNVVEVGAGFSHSMARTGTLYTLIHSSHTLLSYTECGKMLCWGKLQGVDDTGAYTHIHSHALTRTHMHSRI